MQRLFLGLLVLQEEVASRPLLWLIILASAIIMLSFFTQPKFFLMLILSILFYSFIKVLLFLMEQRALIFKQVLPHIFS
jgi:hypothetical protein